MEVKAIPNELGLHTARFHPELPQVERNKLVVSLLENAETRDAKFVCCAVLLVNGKEYKYLHETHGTISTELKGTGGFGYNPIFIPKGYNETYAELSDEEKYKVMLKDQLHVNDHGHKIYADMIFEKISGLIK